MNIKKAEKEDIKTDEEKQSLNENSLDMQDLTDPKELEQWLIDSEQIPDEE